jgi:hypothetical protein
MITRRHALKIAAALGASRAVAPDVALRGLDPDAPLPHLPAQIHAPEDPFAPANFAENGMAWLRSGFEEFSSVESPQEYARFQRARYALMRMDPALRHAGVGHPWTDLQEAAFALMGDGFASGRRVGAHFEPLRLAVVGPVRPCRRCWGVGRLGPHGERYPEHDERPCEECRGRGTVPTPGVRAA